MSAELDAIIDEMEKDAFSLKQVADTAKGFFQGARSADNERRLLSAAKHIAGDAHVPEEAFHGALKTIGAASEGAHATGLLGRLKHEINTGVQHAKEQWQHHARQNAAQEYARHGGVPAVQQAVAGMPAPRVTMPAQAPSHVPAPTVHAPTPAPAVTAAAPAAGTAVAPSFGQRAREFAGRHAPGVAAGAALGAGGYAAYRGAQNAAEQDTRMQDYMANMRHDLNSPLPSMTVTASYEKFAAEKLAAPDAMYMTVPSAMAKSLGDTLSQKLVADPIDALHSKLRKKMVDEPAWENNFNAAVASDPMLSRIHTENPDMLRNAFASVKRFSPSLAKDLLATRNLMRHVAMSGGEMDHATMKLLAETEKFHNESRRR